MDVYWHTGFNIEYVLITHSNFSINPFGNAIQFPFGNIFHKNFHAIRWIEYACNSLEVWNNTCKQKHCLKRNTCLHDLMSLTFISAKCDLTYFHAFHAAFVQVCFLLLSCVLLFKTNLFRDLTKSVGLTQKPN